LRSAALWFCCSANFFSLWLCSAVLSAVSLLRSSLLRSCSPSAPDLVVLGAYPSDPSSVPLAHSSALDLDLITLHVNLRSIECDGCLNGARVRALHYPHFALVVSLDVVRETQQSHHGLVDEMKRGRGERARLKGAA
jgi:hypothetical protein